jgi:hypothetical protein
MHTCLPVPANSYEHVYHCHQSLHAPALHGVGAESPPCVLRSAIGCWPDCQRMMSALIMEC